MTRHLVILAILLLMPVLQANAAEPPPEADRAVRAMVASYAAAFNERDAAKLANHWAADAVYINRTSGQRVSGRDAIQKQFEELFRDDDQLQLTVDVKSLRLISDETAVEEGTAQLISSKSPPVESDYLAVYVKQDGKWLLDTVREVDLPTAPSHHQHLEELAWMIGEWVDQDENATVRTKVEWTKNRNFIKRTFSMSIKDRVELEGTQVIGWDPARGQIRSWVFDSDGGFGHGVWTREGDQWIVNATATLADGRRGSHVRVLTYVDDNTCTLQTVHREVDGQILPNIDEFQVIRVGAENEHTASANSAASKNTADDD